MRKKTRQIELGIAFSNGDSCGHWNTDYVEIPLNTPKKDIQKIACAAMEKKLADDGSGDFAQIWVYNIPDPETTKED
jgi:hypothetical protein